MAAELSIVRAAAVSTHKSRSLYNHQHINSRSTSVCSLSESYQHLITSNLQQLESPPLHLAPLGVISNAKTMTHKSTTAKENQA